MLCIIFKRTASILLIGDGVHPIWSSVLRIVLLMSRRLSYSLSTRYVFFGSVYPLALIVPLVSNRRFSCGICLKQKRQFLSGLKCLLVLVKRLRLLFVFCWLQWAYCFWELLCLFEAYSASKCSQRRVHQSCISSYNLQRSRCRSCSWAPVQTSVICSTPWTTRTHLGGRGRALREMSLSSFFWCWRIFHFSSDLEVPAREVNPWADTK